MSVNLPKVLEDPLEGVLGKDKYSQLNPKEDDIFPEVLPEDKPKSPKQKKMSKEKSPPKAEPNDVFKKTEEVNPVVLVYSVEGGGKTHFAISTTPAPHYMVETEGGHNLITAKTLDPDHLATKIMDREGRKPSEKWFSTSFGLWQQLESAAQVLNDMPKGTVVVDSGSDMLPMTVAELSIEWERGDKAFPPMLYGQVYGVLASLVHQLRDKHNVVITARVKDEYQNDERTGRLKLDLWRSGVYLADHVVRIDLDEDYNRTYSVEKGPLMGVITRSEITWDDLVKGDRKKFMKETEKIKMEREMALLVQTAEKAFQFLKQNNISYERKDVASMSPEEAHKYIDELRQLAKQSNQ